MEIKRTKVLWLCNVIVPKIQEMLGQNVGNSGGWLVNTLDELDKDDRFEIAYCAPYKNHESIYSTSLGAVTFFGFNKKVATIHL